MTRGQGWGPGPPLSLGESPGPAVRPVPHGRWHSSSGGLSSRHAASPGARPGLEGWSRGEAGTPWLGGVSVQPRAEIWRCSWALWKLRVAPRSLSLLTCLLAVWVEFWGHRQQPEPVKPCARCTPRGACSCRPRRMASSPLAAEMGLLGGLPPPLVPTGRWPVLPVPVTWLSLAASAGAPASVLPSVWVVRAWVRVLWEPSAAGRAGARSVLSSGQGAWAAQMCLCKLSRQQLWGWW